MRIAAIQHDIVWEDGAATRRHLEPMVAGGSGLRRRPGRADRDVRHRLLAGGRAHRRAGGRADLDVDAASRPRRTACGCTARWPSGARRRGRPRNVGILAGPDGTAHRYAKLHPFTYAGEHEHYDAGDGDGDGRRRRASGSARSSATTCASPTSGGRWRPTTDCYLCCANWPEARRSHWQALLQARAIENQAYVVGVNRVGEGGGLTYAGDSRIFDPAGRGAGRCRPDRDGAAGRRRRRRGGEGARALPLPAGPPHRRVADRRRPRREPGVGCADDRGPGGDHRQRVAGAHRGRRRGGRGRRAGDPGVDEDGDPGHRALVPARWSSCGSPRRTRSRRATWWPSSTRDRVAHASGGARCCSSPSTGRSGATPSTTPRWSRCASAQAAAAAERARVCSCSPARRRAFCAGADLTGVEDSGVRRRARRVLQGFGRAAGLLHRRGRRRRARRRDAAGGGLRPAGGDAGQRASASRPPGSGLAVDDWTDRAPRPGGRLAGGPGHAAGGRDRHRPRSCTALGFVHRTGRLWTRRSTGPPRSPSWRPLTIAAHKLALERSAPPPGVDDWSTRPGSGPGPALTPRRAARPSSRSARPASAEPEPGPSVTAAGRRASRPGRPGPGRRGTRR